MKSICTLSCSKHKGTAERLRSNKACTVILFNCLKKEPFHTFIQKLILKINVWATETNEKFIENSKHFFYIAYNHLADSVLYILHLEQKNN